MRRRVGHCDKSKYGLFLFRRLAKRKETAYGLDIRNEQQDCSGFARLRRHGKHVWWQQKELAAMDAQLVETTIKAYLTEIRNRLEKAAGIGRAADACAGAGFHEKGLEVALDMEQLLYEATTLLNAACVINRIARQS